MQVSIKSFDVEMDVKNSGVEFGVYDTPNNGGKFLGDCFVTKTGLIWCKGKTKKNNGVKVSWKKFIEMVEK